MTTERLVELQKLCGAATPGPWTNGLRGSGASGDAHMCQILARRTGDMGGYGEYVAVTWHPKFQVSYVGITRQQCVDNAEFIAAARTALPDALAEIDRLNKRWHALKDYAHHYNEQLVFQEMTRLERES